MNPSPPLRWRFLLRALVWIVLLVAAVAQLRATGDTVNADGINYIELAQRAASGHLDFASNGYWSPLYPAMIAVGLTVARPLQLDALAVARGVNVVAIVLCALAFEWLLATFERASSREDGHASLGLDVVRRIAMYALLLWGVLRLQHAATVTPDLLVWTAVSLATALLVRARAGTSSRRDAAAFGVVLGAGYLAKAVLFPVGLASLAAYGLVVGRSGGSAQRSIARAALAFAIVAAPLVIVQSATQGHLSFGETGRLNYRWYVSHPGEERAIREPSEATARRTAANPAAVLLESVPGAVLYAGESAGSFPHGFDPSRSERRGGGALNLASQGRVLRQNLYWYWVVAGSLTLLALLPIVLAALDRLTPRLDRWESAVPALALLGLYLLTHVEGRLCGPAIVTLLVIMAHACRAATRATVRCAQIAAFVWLGLVALARTFNAQAFASRGGGPVGQADVARSASAAGLPAGEWIAMIGSPYGHYWVHLAGLRIGMVIPIPDAAHPLDMAAVGRAVAESCARGMPIGAVVWQSDAAEMPAPVRRIGGNWWGWRPGGRCAGAAKTATAVPSTRVPST